MRRTSTHPSSDVRVEIPGQFPQGVRLPEVLRLHVPGMAPPEVDTGDDGEEVETRGVADLVRDAVHHHANVDGTEDNKCHPNPLQDLAAVVGSLRLQRGSLVNRLADTCSARPPE